jgi:hypothetical protein
MNTSMFRSDVISCSGIVLQNFLCGIDLKFFEHWTRRLNNDVGTTSSRDEPRGDFRFAFSHGQDPEQKFALFCLAKRCRGSVTNAGTEVIVAPSERRIRSP